MKRLAHIIPTFLLLYFLPACDFSDDPLEKISLEDLAGVWNAEKYQLSEKQSGYTIELISRGGQHTIWVQTNGDYKLVHREPEQQFADTSYGKLWVDEEMLAGRDTNGTMWSFEWEFEGEVLILTHGYEQRDLNGDGRIEGIWTYIRLR